MFLQVEDLTHDFCLAAASTSCSVSKRSMTLTLPGFAMFCLRCKETYDIEGLLDHVFFRASGNSSGNSWTTIRRLNHNNDTSSRINERYLRNSVCYQRFQFGVFFGWF